MHHKKSNETYNGKPGRMQDNMKGKDDYTLRIRECFALAYRFLDRHKQARTDEDWDAIVTELAQYRDPFTVKLLVAVVEEIEREYKGAVDKMANK